jgi:hypothetical protein
VPVNFRPALAVVASFGLRLRANAWANARRYRKLAVLGRCMRRKVSEIFSNPYGQDAVCCEPSRNEIERAVRENNLPKRGFQEQLDELKAEWERSGDERYYQIRMYHARRIAFFVRNWDDSPIILKKDMSEGSHRIRAGNIQA